MSIIVRKAKETDLLHIQRLVAKAGLREEGIEQHLEGFLVVVNDKNDLIGTAGLEKYDNDALLRSLVLDSKIWSAQLSLEFFHILLAHAKDQQIETIYLCSIGSNALFEQLGFEEVPIEKVPQHIKQSSHFQRNLKTNTKAWLRTL